MHDHISSNTSLEAVLVKELLPSQIVSTLDLRFILY